MKLCKRILAGLVLLLSAAGLLLSMAAGVGVWVVKGPVTAKVTGIFERVDGALNVAEEGLEHVKASLSRAAERLDQVRQEQRKLLRQGSRNNPMSRFLARTVQHSVAPQFTDAHQTLNAVAEAAVVVNSVLDDVGGLPFFSGSGLALDDLRELNNSLTQVETSAWQMSRLFAESSADADAEASAELSRIERALTRIQRLVADYEPKLTLVRQRTDQLQANTLPWITPAAVAVTGVFFWIGLSQISLLVHAWSWMRK